jgi:hypothetical protein
MNSLKAHAFKEFIHPLSVLPYSTASWSGSTDRGWMNSLKAHALLAVILSLVKAFFFWI